MLEPKQTLPEKPGDQSILILSGVRGDTRRYRTLHLFEQLRLVGIDCALSHLTDPQLPRLLERAKMVIFHRTPLDGYVDKLLERLRRRGALVILDVDDLVFDPAAFQWIDSPDFQDPLRAKLYRAEMERQREMLDSSQAVLASTDFLAERVRNYGKPAWMHRNAFSHEMLELSEAAYSSRRTNRERIVIGYASGTPTHDRDFEIAKPALKHILQRFHHMELWLIGKLDPGSNWGVLADRIKRIPWVPWRKLPELMVQLDINLAPLVIDNPFAQSKSEIKYMEAALLRLPTVASPTGAFQTAIRSGENGFLANTPAEWAEALESLVREQGVRLQVGQRAYEHALAHYHASRRAHELLATLNQIQESLAGSPLESAEASHTQYPVQGFRIDPAIERSPSLWRMALYSLRHRGIRTLGTQVWIYIRRLLAPVWPYRRSG